MIIKPGTSPNSKQRYCFTVCPLSSHQSAFDVVPYFYAYSLPVGDMRMHNGSPSGIGGITNIQGNNISSMNLRL